MKLENEQIIKLYTNLVRVRKLDEVMEKALLAGKVPGHWTSQGLFNIGTSKE